MRVRPPSLPRGASGASSSILKLPAGAGRPAHRRYSTAHLRGGFVLSVVEFHPFTGERQIAEEHPVLKLEATFRQTVETVRKLNARRVVMTHIGEPDQLSCDDLQLLSDRLRGEGVNSTFPYDTMLFDV